MASLGKAISTLILIGGISFTLAACNTRPNPDPDTERVQAPEQTVTE